MKKLLLIMLLPLFYSCQKEIPVKSEPIVLGEGDDKVIISQTDTLRKEVIEGVFMSVDSLKSIYSLDESLTTRVFLKNESSKTGLPLFIGSYPPIFLYRVETMNNVFVAPGGIDVGMAEFNDTIKPGRMLMQDITWNQSSYNSTAKYTGLKAFSGNYILTIYLSGVYPGNNARLTKYITINETGDPLSYSLEQDYKQADSVKCDLVIRNRITRPYSLTRDTDSCTLAFTAHSTNPKADTLFISKFNMTFPEYVIQPFADLLILRVGYSKKDLIVKGVKGAVDLSVHLKFKERIITGKRFLFIN